MKKSFIFNYLHFESLESLPEADRIVVDAAYEAVQTAYAPYSKFKVGAAALLESGKIMVGNNQESEVFPAGICAERNLLFHHQATAPDDSILTLAIASDPSERECYPCGICRQVINDVQKRQGRPIRVIMCSSKSATVVEDARFLLPFTFEL